MERTEVDVTLALPTYNESQTIALVLSEAISVLESLERSWEILVIDNASTDDTVMIADGFASRDPRIHVVRHDENRLYSGSCRTALQLAQGKLVGFMDSDGQAIAQDLPRFIGLLEQGHNLVFGWRSKRDDPLGRLVASRLFNILGKWYVGYPFHDLNCGWRMFDRTFIDVADIRYRVNSANPELFVRARLAQLSVAEVEIGHRPRFGGRTSHNFRKPVQVFLDSRRYFRSLQRELRDAKLAK
jgi:glycosyltransferase involved in cell wall biosynthesis